MKLNALPRRALAASAVSALAVGGAVLATPAAQAAPATNVYSCAVGPTAIGDLTVIGDVPKLPATVAAGTDVPAGLLDITHTVKMTGTTYQTLAAFQVQSVEIPDYKATLGETVVGATGLTAPTTGFTSTDNGATYSGPLNGKNAAFEVPAAGTYAVSPPSAFSVAATTSSGSKINAACTLKAGSTLAKVGDVEVTKNASTVKGKAKKVRWGKAATVKVKVMADNEDATGKVVAKIGKKKVGKAKIEDGKGKLMIKPKFIKKLGAVKVKLQYSGDSYTEAGKGKVKLKVVK